MRHGARPRRGMAVPRGSRPSGDEPGAKGPSRRVCGATGCDAPDIGVERKPIGSTWRPPPRSRWIGSWPGSTNAHEPRHGPRAALRALPPAPYPLGHALSRRPRTCLGLSVPPNASAKTILYSKNNFCSALVDKASHQPSAPGMRFPHLSRQHYASCLRPFRPSPISLLEPKSGFANSTS